MEVNNWGNRRMRVLEFIFGRRNRENRFLGVVWWFFAGYYMLMLPFAVAMPVNWISVLAFAVLYPVLFRVVYYLNSAILTKKWSKKMLVAGGSVIAVLIIGTTATTFFFADNVSVNATRTATSEGYQLSVGSLKGNYQVADFDVSTEGVVVIPYQASVGEGSMTLYVERGGRIIWEKTILSSWGGNIEFHGEPGTYDIKVKTEEAKDVNVKLKNE
ncbi:hypothetical protein [Alteribacter salitolerans]|uniref:hypothetical protein n=1 Tax=Alteribacter salitolerans TaxID=2912333 RepID=UPI00196530E3|nr:hypothetical protein [Alteribacter salitolerans]